MACRHSRCLGDLTRRTTRHRRSPRPLLGGRPVKLPCPGPLLGGRRVKLPCRGPLLGSRPVKRWGAHRNGRTVRRRHLRVCRRQRRGAPGWGEYRRSQWGAGPVFMASYQLPPRPHRWQRWPQRRLQTLTQRRQNGTAGLSSQTTTRGRISLSISAEASRVVHRPPANPRQTVFSRNT
jgi:hypothetical protein